MPDTPEPIRAPQDAIAWTPHGGWLYDAADIPDHLMAGEYVLVVSDDGMVRGVEPTAVAPLAAMLRVDSDVTELVLRLNDIAEHAQQALAARRTGGAS